ncbi:MAG: carbohydrate binding family 9 domain-containing protein [Bacteroidales bacterium]|nr:carbohydrate binding family 9 domain-containing protein [Bacteroidales bacterium]
MKEIIVLLCCAIVSLPVFSQSEEIAVKSYEVQRLQSQPPVIDGVLDEGIWENATRAGDFLQFQPHEGIAPSHQTEFAIYIDDNNIYVGLWAYDNSPDSISRRLTRRDDIDGDVIGVDFDSYHDHRTAFGFWVSSSGVKLDRIMSGDGSNEDTSWDPNWYVKTDINDKGWTAEMRIPFSQLRFEVDSKDGWGLNVMRLVFRREEVSIWQRVPRGSSGIVNHYGHMTGITGIKPKKQFDVTPYTVVSTERFEAQEGNPFKTGKGNSYTAGMDAKIGITNNLTLDLTVNPDFGQVEADPSQVNLTAYETFFEEKRPFFIEGRSILSMPLMIGDGDMSRENLFYTRRIGRRPHGYPGMTSGEYADVPPFTKILGAGKVTGKTENGWSIGVLESVTAEERAEIDLDGERRFEAVEPLTNYFIGTVHKDINEGNTIISGMVTSTNRRLDDTPLDYLHKSAYTGGFDFTQFFKNKTYLLSVKTYFSQVAGSTEAITRTQRSSAHYFQRPDATHLELDSTRTSLTGNGGSIMFGKVGNSPLNIGAFLNWKTPGVELNDVGYIRSTDEIISILWASYQFYEPFSIFRILRLNSAAWTAFDFSGTYMGVGGNFNMNTQFTNFWSFSMGLNGESESLSTGILRGGPAFITPGSFSPFININSDGRKKLILSFSAFAPSSAQGHSQTQGADIELTYRPFNIMTVSLSPNVMLNKSNLQYVGESSYNGDSRYIFGSIDQKVIGMSLRINLTITPDLTIQYWGQPFIATGSYSNMKMITDPLAVSYTDRYHEFSDDQISCYKDDGYCSIDENTDGLVDYYISYPDFNFKEFKSNLVARWEFRPGSVFYLVWSQGRTGYHSYGDLELGRDFGDLYGVIPHNIFLMKFSYRFGL